MFSFRSKSFFHLLIVMALFATLLMSSPLFAQTTGANMPTPNPGYGLQNPIGNRTVPGILGDTVAWLGGLAGSLFFAYLLWGGVQWMTAGGDSKRVQTAQGKIVAATTGIIVVLLAYLAVATVIGLVPR